MMDDLSDNTVFEEHRMAMNVTGAEVIDPGLILDHDFRISTPLAERLTPREVLRGLASDRNDLLLAHSLMDQSAKFSRLVVNEPITELAETNRHGKDRDSDRHGAQIELNLFHIIEIE